VPGSLLIPPGDKDNMKGLCIAWRLGARGAPLGGDGNTRGLGKRWRLAVRKYRQAVWTGFAWRHLGLRRAKIL